MQSGELPRLADGDSEAERSLRDALRDARADAPDAAQLGRMFGAVRASLATPSLPQVGSDAAAAKLAAMPHGMLAVGGFVALVAAIALAVFAASRSAAPGMRSGAAPAEGERRAAPPSTAMAHVGTGLAPEALPNAQAAPAPRPPLATSPSRGAQPSYARPAHTSSRKRQLAPAPASEDVDVVGELRLLAEAKRELATAPERGYALLQQHREAYPSGRFVEEREALTIEALFRLGRKAEAQDHAATFRARFPKSAYLRRVHDLLSGRVGTRE
jgi:hypothetical protein